MKPLPKDVLLLEVQVIITSMARFLREVFSALSFHPTLTRALLLSYKARAVLQLTSSYVTNGSTLRVYYSTVTMPHRLTSNLPIVPGALAPRQDYVPVVYKLPPFLLGVSLGPVAWPRTNRIVTLFWKHPAWKLHHWMNDNVPSRSAVG